MKDIRELTEIDLVNPDYLPNHFEKADLKEHLRSIVKSFFSRRNFDLKYFFKDDYYCTDRRKTQVYILKQMNGIYDIFNNCCNKESRLSLYKRFVGNVITFLDATFDKYYFIRFSRYNNLLEYADFKVNENLLYLYESQSKANELIHSDSFKIFATSDLREEDGYNLVSDVLTGIATVISEEDLEKDISSYSEKMKKLMEFYTKVCLIYTPEQEHKLFGFVLFTMPMIQVLRGKCEEEKVLISLYDEENKDILDSFAYFNELVQDLIHFDLYVQGFILDIKEKASDNEFRVEVCQCINKYYHKLMKKINFCSETKMDISCQRTISNYLIAFKEDVESVLQLKNLEVDLNTLNRLLDDIKKALGYRYNSWTFRC